jgi:hypothetical protein
MVTISSAPDRAANIISDDVAKRAETDDQAQQAMLRDIDAILARLETGIASQHLAMDALLNRLHSRVD